MKHFVLPMFDTDIQKSLRKKQRNLSPTGVFDELKLSENLLDELGSVRLHLNSMIDTADQAVSDLNTTKSELHRVKADNKKLRKASQVMAGEIKHLKKVNHT